MLDQTGYLKKIHHFRDPTLGTLGEWLVGKLRILKVLESLYVGEAQTPIRDKSS